MKVLMGHDVVLDLLLERRPFSSAAGRLFSLVEEGVFEGVIGATTLAEVYELAAQRLGRAGADAVVRDLMTLLEVAAVGRVAFLEAAGSVFADPGVALLHAAAQRAGAEAIVTRDPGAYAGATLDVYAPSELFAALVATRVEEETEANDRPEEEPDAGRRAAAPVLDTHGPRAYRQRNHSDKLQRGRSMITSDDIESYLLTMGVSFETVKDGFWIVQEDEFEGAKIVIAFSDPIVTFRVKLADVPKAGREELFAHLLRLNAEEMVSGAYALEGDNIVVVETLQAANLDLNEFEAAIDTLIFAITEHYPALAPLIKH
jgi:predicted nucleic acid-binding protein